MPAIPRFGPCADYGEGWACGAGAAPVMFYFMWEISFRIDAK
jgi:hypothetical protein